MDKKLVGPEKAIGPHDYTGDWIQAPSSTGDNKVYGSCLQVSEADIKCTFNTYLPQHFTVIGPSIRNRDHPETSGKFNRNNMTITWYSGSSFFTIWYRPDGRN